MNSKTLSTVAFVFLAALNLAVYQNCAKVAVNDAAPDQKLDAVALASNEQGQPVPVDVGTTDELPPTLPPPLPPAQPPVAENPPGDDAPPVEDGGPAVPPTLPPGENLAAACGLDLKTIRNIVDLSQFKDQDVNLDLLKGKTLVYSSDASVTLKSLSIETAVGRTILCGIKVDRLDIKKGRLEVYRSEIKEIGHRNGVLIKDNLSILPAGA